MAYKFAKVQREVMSGEDKGQTKTYAVAKSAGVCDLSKLCKLISARSSLSPADVKSVLDSFNWAMDVELQSGNIVQLGEFGNFRLSIRTRGEVDRNDFSAANIKKAKLVFTPGKSLRTTLVGVPFQEEQIKTVVEDALCLRQHVA